MSDTSSVSSAKFASAAERKDQYAGNQVGETIQRGKVSHVTAGREHSGKPASLTRAPLRPALSQIRDDADQSSLA